MDKETEELINKLAGRLERSVRRAILIYVIFWTVPALAHVAVLIYMIINIKGWVE